MLARVSDEPYMMNRKDSANGLRVSTYNYQNPQVFVFPLSGLNPIESERSKPRPTLLMFIHSSGENVYYLENENVILKKPLRGLKLVEDTEDKRFTVYFANDPRPYVHCLHAGERYREEIIAVLTMTASASFSHFETQVAILHEGHAQQRMSNWGSWMPRYVRCVNGRLMVYRTPDSQNPLEVFPITIVKWEKKRGNGFKVRTASRKLVLRCGTVAERDLWIQVLETARSRAETEWRELWEQCSRLKADNKKKESQAHTAAITALPSPSSSSPSLSPSPIPMPMVKSGSAPERMTVPASDGVEVKRNSKRSMRKSKSIQKVVNIITADAKRSSTDDDDGDVEDEKEVPELIRRQSTKRFEVHSIVQGNDRLVNAKYNHWQQIYAYELSDIKAATPGLQASILHVNIADKVAEYFQDEKLVHKKPLCEAVVLADTMSDVRFNIRFREDQDPIIHTLEDSSLRPEVLDLLFITTSSKFHELHTPTILVHKGACEKRGRTTLFWHYRYLQLLNGRLFIFRNPDSSIPIGVRSLLSATVNAKSSNRLHITFPQGKWVFRFSSQEERDAWQKAMRLSIERGRRERRELQNQSVVMRVNAHKHLQSPMEERADHGPSGLQSRDNSSTLSKSSPSVASTTTITSNSSTSDSINAQHRLSRDSSRDSSHSADAADVVDDSSDVDQGQDSSQPVMVDASPGRMLQLQWSRPKLGVEMDSHPITPNDAKEDARRRLFYENKSRHSSVQKMSSTAELPRRSLLPADYKKNNKVVHHSWNPSNLTTSSSSPNTSAAAAVATLTKNARSAKRITKKKSGSRVSRSASNSVSVSLSASSNNSSQTSSANPSPRDNGEAPTKKKSALAASKSKSSQSMTSVKKSVKKSTTKKDHSDFEEFPPLDFASVSKITTTDSSSPRDARECSITTDSIVSIPPPPPDTDYFGEHVNSGENTPVVSYTPPRSSSPPTNDYEDDQDETPTPFHIPNMNVKLQSVISRANQVDGHETLFNANTNSAKDEDEENADEDDSEEDDVLVETVASGGLDHKHNSSSSLLDTPKETPGGPDVIARPKVTPGGPATTTTTTAATKSEPTEFLILEVVEDSKTRPCGFIDIAHSDRLADLRVAIDEELDYSDQYVFVKKTVKGFVSVGSRQEAAKTVGWVALDGTNVHIRKRTED